jgi:hypothetical protein
MAISKTVIHHASDWIDWIDASGSVGPQRRINDRLELSVGESPADLQLISRDGRTRVWRAQQEALHLSVAGRASEAQMAYPSAATFSLAGEVRDGQHRYNPRRFSITVGDASGHSVELFRSPFGTRFASAGGLRGNARFEDGKPASWAVFTIVVTTFEVTGQPELTNTVSFRAQADRHGDFVLAMDRLPALNKSGAPQHYKSELTALALASASGSDIADPDGFVPAQIRSPADAANFATPIQLNVSPGTVSTLTSKDQPHLVLRIP